MNQSEVKAFPVGCGAATLMECSNNPNKPWPRVVIMKPWCPGDGSEPSVPAHSMVLDAAETRMLYEALHQYYLEAYQTVELPKKPVANPHPLP